MYLDEVLSKTESSLRLDDTTGRVFLIGLHPTSFKGI